MALLLAAAFVLGWGYWYSSRHADLQIVVEDYARRSTYSAFGSPHDVAITFRDQSGRQIAEARSVEPQGYMLALHPDASVGNCQHRNTQPDYSACYERYSAWAATWARLADRADVAVGGCSLRGVPVAIREFDGDWVLWWVPLPHGGGLPRRQYTLSLAIDSARCVAVGSTALGSRGAQG